MFSQLKNRYNEIAYWKKAIKSHDNEEIRASLIEKPFRCLAKQLRKYDVQYLQGATGLAISLVLYTDFKEANLIEAGDMIKYQDFSYSVKSIEKIRGLANKRSFEFIIYIGN